MAISTYSELKTAIANFLARDDLTSVIPDFIQLAEATMSRELETRSQEKRATATLTADDEYIALPTDLREVREVKLNTTPITVLTYYSPVALDQKFSSGGTGKPKGFSIVGDEMKLRPVPDSSYTAEIIYIGSITSLSDSNATNNILSRSPDAYLYGSRRRMLTFSTNSAPLSTCNASTLRSNRSRLTSSAHTTELGRCRSAASINAKMQQWRAKQCLQCLTTLRTKSSTTSSGRRPTPRRQPCMSVSPPRRSLTTTAAPN